MYTIILHTVNVSYEQPVNNLAYTSLKILKESTSQKELPVFFLTEHYW